jgi:hypothetical protein
MLLLIMCCDLVVMDRRMTPAIKLVFARNYPAPVFVHSQTDKAHQLWYSDGMLTHEEISAVYDQGPEAGMALVERLSALMDQQQTQIAELRARVHAREDQLATQSRNSSKPPSRDSFMQQTRSLRQPSGSKTGG